MVQVEWCRSRYSGTGTVVQAQWYRYSGAGTVVQVQGCGYGGTGTVVEVLERWYSYSVPSGVPYSVPYSVPAISTIRVLCWGNFLLFTMVVALVESFRAAFACMRF